MSKRLQVYEADGVVVTFDPNLCIHSENCITSLPAVFDVSDRRWIRPERAPAEEVAATVARCPSGALQIVRAGSAPVRSGVTAEAVTVTVKPNGPLLVRGPVRVVKENGEEVTKDTCAFCRCGGTQNAPFCDGTHNRLRFKSPS